MWRVRESREQSRSYEIFRARQRFSLRLIPHDQQLVQYPEMSLRVVSGQRFGNGMVGIGRDSFQCWSGLKGLRTSLAAVRRWRSARGCSFGCGSFNRSLPLFSTAYGDKDGE